MPSKIERVYKAIKSFAGEKVTSRQIAKQINNLSPGEVGQALKNLYILGLVEQIQIHTHHVEYLWRVKKDGE